MTSGERSETGAETLMSSEGWDKERTSLQNSYARSSRCEGVAIRSSRCQGLWTS